MRHLKSTVHPDIEHLDDKIVFQRNAARAIVLDGEDVLLLYTERYHDYTLPGGGIDD
ncbi:DNA mismatch repair protein MutT, partial [Vibrio parahaemolyticus]|nr:DNA mismatch repair protein MutT [Vibrio parahaemolyticus]